MSQNRYKTKKGLGFEYHCPGHDVAPGICKIEFINEKYILKAVTVLLDRWVKVAMKERKLYKEGVFLTKLKGISTEYGNSGRRFAENYCKTAADI